MNIKSINGVELTNIKSFNNVLVRNIHSVNNILQNYAFNLDLSTFKDTVTGQSLSCNIDGTRYDEVNGVITAFATDVPTIADNGLRICGAYSNLLPYSSNPHAWNSNVNVQSTADNTFSNGITCSKITRITTLATSVSTLSIPSLASNNTLQFSIYFKNIISDTAFNLIIRNKTTATNIFTYQLLISNNFIPQPNPSVQIFNIDSGYKINIKQSTAFSVNDEIAVYAFYAGYTGTVGDTITCGGASLIFNKYSLPYIPTAEAPVSSPSEAGNSSTGTGIWIDDVATNFPLLNTALTSQGTLTFKWKTGFNDADVSGNLNILSFNGTTNSISYDADNNLIKITDGTNTASKALTVVADTEYTITAIWGLVSGSPKMQIAVDGTAGTQANFTGTFNPSDIYFGLNNEELQYIKDLVVLKAATWL